VPEKTLGEVLREVRESRGMTQAQLAEKAQVALSFVTVLEAGHQRNPSRQVVYRLARALNVPVKRLLDPDE
jgi:XRE family transcriptional regulator of biofilm formation